MKNNIFNKEGNLRDKLLQIQEINEEYHVKVGTNKGSAYIFCGSVNDAFNGMQKFLDRDIYKVFGSVDDDSTINILVHGTEHGRYWFEGDDRTEEGDAKEFGSVKEKNYLVSHALGHGRLPNEYTMEWYTEKDTSPEFVKKERALKKQKADLKRALEAAYELGYDFSGASEKIINATGPRDISHIMHTLAFENYI